MSVFEQVKSNKLLEGSSIILFLNKKDQFQKKIQEKGNLSTYYPDYKGTNLCYSIFKLDKIMQSSHICNFLK